MSSSGISNVADLLQACSLEVEVDSTTLEELHTHLESGRPQLLNALKTAGVTKLGDRQALANAMSKAKREGRLQLGTSLSEVAGSAPQPVRGTSAVQLPVSTVGYTPLPRVTKRPLMPKSEWQQAIRKSTAGDTYGILFPHTHAQIPQYGAEWLTRAFRLAGTITADNSVAEIVEFKQCLGGGAAEKAFLTVRYAHEQPGLHTRLFCKFPRALVLP
jgi:hypothetical protein